MLLVWYLFRWVGVVFLVLGWYLFGWGGWGVVFMVLVWYLLGVGGWVGPWKKSEKCPLVPSMVPIY